LQELQRKPQLQPSQSFSFLPPAPTSLSVTFA
jgi:hypothetical protein